MFISKEEKCELFREIGQIKEAIGFMPGDNEWFGSTSGSKKISQLSIQIEDLKRELKMLERYVGVARRQGDFDRLERIDDLCFTDSNVAGNNKTNKSK